MSFSAALSGKVAILLDGVFNVKKEELPQNLLDATGDAMKPHRSQQFCFIS